MHMQVTFGRGLLLVTSGLEISDRPQEVALMWLGSWIRLLTLEVGP